MMMNSDLTYHVMSIEYCITVNVLHSNSSW